MQRGDAVLDVTQIARWAGCIGNRGSVVPVPDAKHDVFLSLRGPREVAYRELDLWLDGYLRADNDASASLRKG
jgi:alpha-beta hydrolase superfamily lysophospholipase